MRSIADLTFMAAITAVLPFAIHIGVLKIVPIRPPESKMESAVERWLFRHLPLIWVLNGALICSAYLLNNLVGEPYWIIPAVLAALVTLVQLSIAMLAVDRFMSRQKRRR